jgi:hypothetical protein
MQIKDPEARLTYAIIPLIPVRRLEMGAVHEERA